MKSKKLKWALLILAVLVLAAVGYVLWGTPAALELFPEEIWQTPHEQTIFHAQTIIDAVETEDLDEQELQEILEEAKLWRIPDPDRVYPGDPCILVSLSTEAGDYKLWIGENGYIYASSTEQRELTDRIIPSPQELMEDFFGSRRGKDFRSAWYRDDGSLYRALMELLTQSPEYTQ